MVCRYVCERRGVCVCVCVCMSCFPQPKPFPPHNHSQKLLSQFLSRKHLLFYSYNPSSSHILQNKPPKQHFSTIPSLPLLIHKPPFVSHTTISHTTPPIFIYLFPTISTFPLPNILIAEEYKRLW